MQNMNDWWQSVRSASTKKAFPILSFPAVSLLGITVKELTHNASLQANAMKRVADECDTLASVSMMDLSVEAEAFGSEIRVSENEVPTVIGRIIESPKDADALHVPSLENSRCMQYVEAIRLAKETIADRPVFAGVIGPFSLSGRLMAMTEIMMNCLIAPDMVHTTLEKATEFIIRYINAFQEAGADGVVMAEPAAGILSPDLNAEFSIPYVKRIIDAVQTKDFSVVYHNCGNVLPMLSDIMTLGASAYHFGNAVDMTEVLKAVDNSHIVMGNIDPAGEFKNGTPNSIRAATTALLSACAPDHSNFVISSGCDIPPLAPWENIRAFFDAVSAYYQQ